MKKVEKNVTTQSLNYPTSETKVNIKALSSLLMGIASIATFVVFLRTDIFDILLLSTGLGIVGTIFGVQILEIVPTIPNKRHLLINAGVVSSITGILCTAIILLAILLLLFDFKPFIRLLPYIDGHYRFLGVDW